MKRGLRVKHWIWFCPLGFHDALQYWSLQPALLLTLFQKLPRSDGEEIPQVLFLHQQPFPHVYFEAMFEQPMSPLLLMWRWETSHFALCSHRTSDIQFPMAYSPSYFCSRELMVSHCLAWTPQLSLNTAIWITTASPMPLSAMACSKPVCCQPIIAICKVDVPIRQTSPKGIIIL